MNITAQVSKESVWGNVDPIEDGWDEKESLDAFQKMLETVLEEEFPGTGITVELVDGFTSHWWGEFPANYEHTMMLDYLIDKVWSSFDWMVAL